MKRIVLLCLIGYGLCYIPLFAQDNSVGINTRTPNANAVLELVSPGSNQGLLIPNLTTAQREAMANSLGTTELGLIVYDGDLNRFYYWHPNGWKAGLGVLSETQAAGDLQGTFPNVTIRDNVVDKAALDQVLDIGSETAFGDAATVITITLDTDGRVRDIVELPISIGSSNIIDLTISNADIADQTITISKLNAEGNTNKVLTTDASGTLYWADENLFLTPALQDGQLFIGSSDNKAIGLPTTGDLNISNSGTSINFEIKDLSIETGDIANGAITSDKILDGTIQSNDIQDGAVGSSQILDGDIQTIDINDAAVTSAKIANSTIVNEDIATGAVQSNSIQNATIISEDLATGAVESSNILNGTIITEDIANDAITSDKLAAGAIQSGDIQDGAVGSTQILDGDIQTIDINDAAVTSAKIANSTIVNEDIATGAIQSNSIQNATIISEDLATGAVESSNILNATIITEDIANDAITTNKISDGSVETSDILNSTILSEDLAIGAVETSDILNGTILTEDIADEAITSEKIEDETIQSEDIGTGEITTNEILNSTIITEDIDNLQVTNEKIAANAVTNAKVERVSLLPDRLLGTQTANGRGLMVAQQSTVVIDFGSFGPTEFYVPSFITTNTSSVVITDANGNVTFEPRSAFQQATLNQGNMFVGTAGGTIQLPVAIDGTSSNRGGFVIGGASTSGSITAQFISGDLWIMNDGQAIIQDNAVQGNDIDVTSGDFTVSGSETILFTNSGGLDVSNNVYLSASTLPTVVRGYLTVNENAGFEANVTIKGDLSFDTGQKVNAISTDLTVSDANSDLATAEAITTYVNDKFTQDSTDIYNKIKADSSALHYALIDTASNIRSDLGNIETDLYNAISDTAEVVRTSLADSIIAVRSALVDSAAGIRSHYDQVVLDTATDIRADLHAAIIDSANDVRSDLASALADSVLAVRGALVDTASDIRGDIASLELDLHNAMSDTAEVVRTSLADSIIAVRSALVDSASDIRSHYDQVVLDTATDIRADLHAAIIDSANDVRSDLASALADSVLSVRGALVDTASDIRSDIASLELDLHNAMSDTADVVRTSLADSIIAVRSALVDSASDIRSHYDQVVLDTATDIRADLHAAIIDSTSAIRTDMASMQSQIDAATTPSLSDVLSMGTDANASSITNINGISVNGSTSLGDDIATDNLTVNSTIQGNLTFEGSSSDGYAVTLAPGTGDANYTVTLPDATTTLVGTDNNQTLSNKTLSTVSISPYNENVTSDIGNTISVGTRSLINLYDDETGYYTPVSLTDGTYDGQMLIIVLVSSSGGSAQDAVTISSDPSTSNARLSSDWGPHSDELGSTITLMWSAVLDDWVELNRSIN